MREYGDYIKEAKRILRNYNKMKVAVLNLDDEIKAQEAMLQGESISAIRYGDDRISGGAGELTATEAAAERRIKIKERIADMRERRDEMERTIRAVDRALEMLDDVEARIVRLRYVDCHAWWQVAREAGYTEKWARERGGKALFDVALMMFGVIARPVQLRLMYVQE